MSKFYNITGSTGVTVEILSPTADSNISSILIANVHASADATVTLFIQNDPASGITNTYNLIKSVAIPAKVSLVLDDAALFQFGDNYGLYITVGSSDTVDVIVNS